MRALVVIAWFFALTAVASAAEPQMRLYFDDAGDPLIAAGDVRPDGWTAREVRRCAPSCVPMATTTAYPHLESHPWRLFAAPGETPAGTSFEAVFDNANGDTRTVRTAPWTGRLAMTRAPALAGDLTMGGTPRWVAGGSTGGAR